MKLERHPVATQPIVSGVIWGAGDALVQRLSSGDSSNSGPRGVEEANRRSARDKQVQPDKARYDFRR